MSIGIHVFGFSFPFVLLLGSVCEAYTGRLSCFRAQVNMPYRIVSCHSRVFTVHTRTLSLTSSQPHFRSAVREGIRSDLIHGSLVSEMTYTVSGGSLNSTQTKPNLGLHESRPQTASRSVHPFCI